MMKKTISRQQFPDTSSTVNLSRASASQADVATVRSAFTIVELLVVIAIIAVLMGLILPAVHYARESARRTQCISNLSQLGKAIHSYESSRGHLPPSKSFTEDDQIKEPGSAHYRLLPWLEQPALHAELDESTLGFHRIDNSPETGPEETKLAIFRCPTDSGSFGTNNYVFCYGSRAHNRNPPEHRGAFDAKDDRARPYLKDVTDGLSNTAAVSERLRGSGDDATFDPHRDIFFSGSELLIGLGPADEMIPICEAAAPSTGQFSSFGGRSWAHSSYEATWYNHVVTPNSSVPNCTSLSAAKLQHHVGGAWRGIFNASSQHSGTVNLLLLDGSVRTTSDSIAASTWQAIGTSAGGETPREY